MSRGSLAGIGLGVVGELVSHHHPSPNRCADTVELLQHRHRDIIEHLEIKPLKVIVDYKDSLDENNCLPAHLIPPLHLAEATSSSGDPTPTVLVGQPGRSVRKRLPSHSTDDVEMEDLGDTDAQMETPKRKDKGKAKKQVVVEIPRYNSRSSAKRVLQGSPTPAATSAKRTRISERDGELESGTGEKTPVQEAKEKGKGREVEEDALTPATATVKNTRATRGSKKTGEAEETIGGVDLGAMEIDEGTPIDPALVLGVEEMVRLCCLVVTIGF